MRIKRTTSRIHEGDLTPMIDMTFQLIAFFMVLINFTQSEQNERVQLPASELAKPPKAPLEYPITLHVTKDAQVIVGGQEVPIEAIHPFLVKEKQALESEGRPQDDATIIIRADRDTETGKVQYLIQRCQDDGFERFALRAREDVNN